MNIYNVSTYGAHGDGLHDDTSAINNASHAAIGNTLQFNAGVYKVSAPISIHSSTYYSGTGTTMLLWPQAGNFIMETDNNASDFSVSGFILNGGGFKYNGTCESCNLYDCAIENITKSTNSVADVGIYISGLADSSIENVAIENVTGDPAWNHGILGYNVTNSEIINNTFDTIAGDCIQILFQAPSTTPAKNVVINGNVGKNLGRMGIEVQSINGSANNVNGLTVWNNRFSDYMGLNSTAPSNQITNNTFGLSVVPSGTGISIQGNYLEGALGSDWGIEVGGTGTVVSDNTVIGHNVGIAVGPSYNVSVVNNKLYGQTQQAILVYSPASTTNLNESGNIVNSTIPQGL